MLHSAPSVPSAPPGGIHTPNRQAPYAFQHRALASLQPRAAGRFIAFCIRTSGRRRFHSARCRTAGSGQFHFSSQIPRDVYKRQRQAQRNGEQCLEQAAAAEHELRHHESRGRAEDNEPRTGADRVQHAVEEIIHDVIPFHHHFIACLLYTSYHLGLERLRATHG